MYRELRIYIFEEHERVEQLKREARAQVAAAMEKVITRNMVVCSLYLD